MAKYIDRVKQIVTTTGTGAYDVSGLAVSGFASFSLYSDGDELDYAITDDMDYEVGLGTISGTTLIRSSITASSNGNAAVSWGAGNKTIFNTVPAEVMNALTTYVDQDVSSDSSPSFTSPDVDTLKVEPTDVGAWAQGQIRYKDNASGLVEDLAEDGVSSPLVENTFKIKNTSGVTLTRGMAVRPTGASGDNPTVSKADPALLTTCQPVGLIRSVSIANNAVGYVTTFGKLGSWDTSGFAEGARLYLSTIAGTLTATKPEYPNIPVRVGVVARSHAVEGLVIIDSGIEHTLDQDVSSGSSPTFNLVDSSDNYAGTTYEDGFSELGELNTANGFDRQNLASIGDISWDNTARTVSIAVASGESTFDYWINGKKYSSATTITSSPLPDTTGIYYFYLTGANLEYIGIAGVTADAFYKYAITALVYYNATTGVGIFFEERHGVRMSSSTHEEMHRTMGAKYAGGFSPTGLVDAQTTFTGTNSGTFFDEDIRHDIAAQTTMPFIYRLGALGEWTWTAADNLVAYDEGGDTVWNEWTGTTWQLTESGSATDYIIMFIAAMPILTDEGTNNPVVKIIGQNGYSSARDARDAIESERKALITDGLPSPEMCFIGAIIVRRNGDLEELSDGSVYLDLRGTSAVGSGGDSVASNIAADITYTPTGDIEATNVQDAITELDTEKADTILLLATDPVSPSTDDIWVNTTASQLKVKTATATIVFEYSQLIPD